MFLPRERHGRIIGVELDAFTGDRDIVVGFDDDAARSCFDLDLACAFDGCLANFTDRIATRAFVQAAANIDSGIAGCADSERFARERDVLAGGELERNGSERQDGAFVGEANGKHELPVGRSDVQEFVGAIFHDIELATGSELQGVGWRGDLGRGGGGEPLFLRVAFHVPMVTGF